MNYFAYYIFFYYYFLIKIINLLSYLLLINKNVFLFFFFFFMRDEISMNFCFPTFDFCDTGFLTLCQFDHLTEGFWP